MLNIRCNLIYFSNNHILVKVYMHNNKNIYIYIYIHPSSIAILYYSVYENIRG